MSDLGTRYVELVERVAPAFGGIYPLSRQLGLHEETLKIRLGNPRRVKREHLYALEHLAQRIEGRPG